MNFLGKKINNLSFNQDNSCFTVATDIGFIVFDLDNLSERFHRTFDGGLAHAIVYQKSNIVILVGGGNPAAFPPNMAILWDDSSNKSITNFECPNEIINIKLDSKNIIIALENFIYIYNFDKLKFKKKIKTGNNTHGLCDINHQGDKRYLICPGLSPGLMRIINLGENNGDRLIQAHKNPLSSLTINPTGDIVASASEQGTLIRIFNTSNGEMIKEYRRGSDKVDIYDITFNNDKTIISVLSDKGTLHIFKIPDYNTYSNLYFMSGIVPLLGSEWSSYKYYLPDNTKYKIAFNDKEPNMIIVLSYNGSIHRLKINEINKKIELIDKLDFF